MRKKIVMVMGVQRSGTTALLDSLSHGGLIAFNESRSDYIYDNFYLRPEPELRALFHEIPGAILLKPLSETFRRSVREVFEEYAGYDLHIVWIYRDPVNATHSIEVFGFTGRPSSVPELAEQWKQRNESLIDALPVYPDRLTVVRYEDLAESPSLLVALGERLGVEAFPHFRGDSGHGRRRMSPELQALVDEVTGKTRARLDAARTVLAPTSVPSLSTSGLDLSSQEFHADPFARLREWREHSGVHNLNLPNSWLVLNYDDVSGILHDAKRFSAVHYRAMSRLLGAADGADQFRLRSLLEPYFTPAAMRFHAERIERHARSLLTELLPSGEFDLVASFALRLFRELSVDRHSLLAGLTADPRLRQDEIADIGRLIALFEYVLVNFIGNAVHYMLLHHEQDEALRSRPADVPAFTDEVLRLFAPGFTLRRLTLCPVEIPVGPIPAQANIFLAIAAANRDPAKYRQPDEMVLHRAGPPHLSFGVGLHAYLGRHIAQAACEGVLRVMLTEFPPLQSVGSIGKIPFTGLPETYGPSVFPVRFDQR
jgi:cytochrome P450